MLCYGLLAALYLAYLGIHREWVGILLWPAVAVHAILTVLLVRAWFQDDRSRIGDRNFGFSRSPR